jgi:hypothetical protein
LASTPAESEIHCQLLCDAKPLQQCKFWTYNPNSIVLGGSCSFKYSDKGYKSNSTNSRAISGSRCKETKLLAKTLTEKDEEIKIQKKHLDTTLVEYGNVLAKSDEIQNKNNQLEDEKKDHEKTI